MERVPDMSDTSPEMEAKQRELWMALPEETRFLMGASMFDAAREMVLASFPPGLSEEETLFRLADRFYGPEIAALWQKGWRARYPAALNPK